MMLQMTICMFALLVCVSITVEIAHAYSSGAGACPGGAVAVGDFHLSNDNGKQVNWGTLADADTTFSIGGQVLENGEIPTFPVGTDLEVKLTAGEVGFRGLLIRIEADNLDLGSSIIPGNGMQISTVCAFGIGSMTHVDNADKTDATGTVRIDQTVENVRIDVTVVYRNTDQLSIFTYGNFTVNFQVDESAITTSPTFTDSTNYPATRSPEESSETLMDVLSNQEELDVFVEALRSAGLLDTLLDDDNQSLTVFAPRNAAFQAIPPALVNVLLTEPWSLHLLNLLNFHIFNGTLLSADLVPSSLEMLNGELVTIIDVGGNVVLSTPLVPGSNIVLVDLEAVNGVSHVIDGVLLPAWFGSDVIGLISSTPGYEIFAEFIQISGIGSLLNPSAVYTILAPTDDAFQALGDDTLNYYRDASNVDELKQLLTDHFIDGVFPSVILADGMEVETMSGSILIVGIDVSGAEEVITFNGSIVVQPNLLANNGVVHGIGELLEVSLAPTPLPFTSFPTPTPVPFTNSPTQVTTTISTTALPFTNSPTQVTTTISPTYPSTTRSASPTPQVTSSNSFPVSSTREPSSPSSADSKCSSLPKGGKGKGGCKSSKGLQKKKKESGSKYQKSKKIRQSPKSDNSFSESVSKSKRGSSKKSLAPTNPNNSENDVSSNNKGMKSGESSAQKGQSKQSKISKSASKGGSADQSSKSQSLTKKGSSRVRGMRDQ